MKVKYFSQIILIFSLISISGLMIYKLYYKLYSKPVIVEKVTILQDFRLETIKGELFTKSNLNENKPTIIGYIEPNCSICNDFISHLSQNEGDNYLIVFDKEQSKSFSKNITEHLSKLGITILYSDKKYLFEHFGIENPSTFLIFNERQIFLKKYIGAKDPKIFLTNQIN